MTPETNTSANPTTLPYNTTNFFNTFVKDPLTSLANNVNQTYQDTKDGLNKQYAGSQAESLVQKVRENEYVQTVNSFASNNALSIGMGVSAIGGFVGTDAVIKLLRNDKGTSKLREVAKLIVAGGMCAASECCAVDADQKNGIEEASLRICLLSGALLKAAWSAASNPVNHRIIVLKTKNRE